MRIIFFDVETTGLDPEKDRIIELSYYLHEDNQLKESYDKLIKHDGLNLSENIVEMTGITNKMLDNEGTTEGTVANDFYDLLYKLNKNNEPTVLIAHNLQFDLNFIYELFRYYFSKEFVDELLSKFYYLDTLTIIKDRKTYPHKLIDMCKYYEIDLDNDKFHHASYDAEVLIKCVENMIVERNDLLDYVNLMGYHPKYGVFGKKFEWLNYKKQGYTKGLCSVEDSLPNTI